MPHYYVPAPAAVMILVSAAKVYHCAARDGLESEDVVRREERSEGGANALSQMGMRVVGLRPCYREERTFQPLFIH